MEDILALAEPLPVNVIDSEEPDQQSVDDSQLPKKFCILKFGKVKYTKGDNEGEFDFTPENAQNIVDEFQKRGKDLVIDYDHGTVSDSHTGDAPAAGWGQNLETTPDGLYAVVKSWTPKGRERLSNKEYRYMSPVLRFNPKGAPVAIHSVALTNHPALHGTQALVAANDLKTKYQTTLKDMWATKKKMEGVLVQTVHSYSDHVSGNEASENEMKAFMEELFKNQSFADDASIQNVLNEISQHKLSNNIPAVDQVSAANKQALNAYLEWLDANAKAQADDALKRLYKAEFDVYSSKLGNLPAEVTSTVPQAPYQPPATPAGVSIAQPIPTMAVAGMNDTAKFTDSAVTDFLKLHDCKTLDDVSKKIMECEIKHKSELKVLNDKLLDIKANELVDKAMKDGKITENMKKVALDMARKDEKLFSDFVKEIPKVVAVFSEPVQSEAKESAVTQVYSDAEKQVANAFGIVPESVFSTNKPT